MDEIVFATHITAKRRQERFTTAVSNVELAWLARMAKANADKAPASRRETITELANMFEEVSKW